MRKLLVAMLMMLTMCAISGFPSEAAEAGNEKAYEYYTDTKTAIIDSAEGLVEFSKDVNEGRTFSGYTVVLTEDIDMEGYEYTPAGKVSGYPKYAFAGYFDGQNHVISNLTVHGDDASGLFGAVSGKVKNVVIDKANITGHHYVGGIVGYSSAHASVEISNNKVKNSKITSTPQLVNGKYTNGNEIGGIIGHTVSLEVIAGNVVENTTITGYREIGGIAGVASGAITNNSTRNITIYQNNTNGYQGGNVRSYGGTLGRNAGAQMKNNTVTNLTSKQVYCIMNAEELISFAEKVNSGSPYAGATVMLTADIDLENTPWTPIGQKDGSTFKGIFDGRDHTISNLYIDSSEQTEENYSSGLFGWVEAQGENDVVIKHLKVDGAKVLGHRNVAVIAGHITSSEEATGKVVVEKCEVRNASIETTHFASTAHDGGDHTGAIVGDATENGKVRKSKVYNTVLSIEGTDAGQVVGAANEENVVACIAKNVTVVSKQGCTGENVKEKVIGKALEVIEEKTEEVKK